MKKFLGIVGALACSFVLAICLGGCWIGDYQIGGRYSLYDDADLYMIGGGTVTEGVADISIHWVSGKITVIASEDATEISIEETQVADEDLKLRYRIVEGMLDIRYAASGATLPGVTNEKDLTVTMPVRGPEFSSLAALSVETVSGSVYIVGQFADEIEVDTVSADVRITEAAAHAISVDTISGDLIVGGKFQTAKFDSVSGDAIFRLGEASGFTCKFDTVSGEFREGFGATKNGDTHTYGDGSLSIRVDTVSGNLRIEKI